jgi:Spy/CpxP family protein refolding chaperone
MNIRKHTLALGIALALGANGAGVAFAQGMPDNQPGQENNMMSGSSGGQGGMGPGMMDGMMGGGQGGMGPSMMKGMMGGGAGMSMMQGMLDPEQREAMREEIQQRRPAQFERMGRLMNLRDDLMAEMHGERPDPEAVQAIHGQLAGLHGEMMAEMVRMQNAMHDLMTDEQRQQLRQAAPADVDPKDQNVHH